MAATAIFGAAAAAYHIRYNILQEKFSPYDPHPNPYVVMPEGSDRVANLINDLEQE